MSATAQAYGLIPAYHPAGQNRANKYSITPAYTTAIYKGALVKLVTAGGIENGDGSTDALGVFAGCEYIDPTGKPCVSAHWPGTASCTNIVAYVYDDQQTVYRVGVGGNASSYTTAAIGDQVDVANNTAGSATTGLSSASLTGALIGAAAQAQVRIVGFYDGVYHATDNPYPQVLVQIAQHQFTADKAAI